MFENIFAKIFEGLRGREDLEICISGQYYQIFLEIFWDILGNIWRSSFSAVPSKIWAKNILQPSQKSCQRFFVARGVPRIFVSDNLENAPVTVMPYSKKGFYCLSDELYRGERELGERVGE